MVWRKVILITVLGLLTGRPSAAFKTKYSIPRPNRRTSSIFSPVQRSDLNSESSVSGAEPIASNTENSTAPASASTAGSISFAAAFKTLSTSKWRSRQSSVSKFAVSSNTKVTVASSSSSTYSALITYSSGTSFKLATPLTAKSSVVPTYRNWVGPHKLEGDAACWREAHILDECPPNYNRNDATNTCWTQCPIEFPIKCGIECVRQNDDCGREILYKVSSIVNVGLNGIMDNWFGKFANMAKSVRTTVYCSCMILGLIRAMLRYIRSVQSSDPHATQAKILAALYQSNAVVVELPITIKMCSGERVTKDWWLADRLMASTQFILAQVLAHSDDLLTSWHQFLAFLKGANFTAPPEEITKGEIGYLTDALQSNSTCGHDLQGLVHRTWATIGALRDQNPGITEGQLRIAVQNTELVKTDIAMVTSNCMELLIQQSSEATAYTTRDKIRKTFGVIINDLITKGKSNNGSSFQADEYAYKMLNDGMGMWVCSGFDMTGISSMISDYFQSICGPTQFIGEVDDGTHPHTLGMNIMMKAFQNSTMSWKKKGDGKVIVTFTSFDTEDVVVNIMSGGTKIDEVELPAGSKAVWKSTVEQLGGKTFYLDRWRPGFLGLPFTSDGSLMLWLPQAAEGGHLDLNVRLNVS